LTPASPNAAGKSVGAFSIRAERLAVKKQLRVELPDSPAVEHLPHGGLIRLQKICDDTQVGRERDDGADVEIPVGPSVEPPADARRDRIVDRRMTQRALDADGAEAAARIAVAGEAHHGLGVEQRQRHRRIVEVDASMPDGVQDVGRERLGVDLQPHGERRRRAHTRTDTAEFLPFDRPVQLERAAPEGLIAECVVPEDPLAFFQHPIAVPANHIVERVRFSCRLGRLLGGGVDGDHAAGARHHREDRRESR